MQMMFFSDESARLPAVHTEGVWRALSPAAAGRSSLGNVDLGRAAKMQVGAEHDVVFWRA